MTWLQHYNPLGYLGLSALVAAIPLFILLYMLGIRRAKGHYAAFFATLAAVLLAIIVWGMPAGLAISATLYGAAFGIFPIVWIVVTAIWVYNMTVECGDFEIIKNSLACVTDDRRLQALFIAFAFGSFIEGTAGFGTPVAITAAMLVGLGFNARYAAGVCLIANTAPVAFGAIGIPIVVAAGVTGLDMMHISKIVGRQLPFLSLIVPLWLSVTMCGWKRSMEILPAIIVAGLCFAVSQFVVSNFVGPYLPDIISAIVTIIGLGIFLHLWKPKAVFHFADEKPAGPVTCQFSAGEVVRAWAPYVILAVMVFLWGLESVKGVLAPFGTSFQWPALHNLVMKTAPIVAKDTAYAAVYKVNIGSAAGTAIFIAGLLSVLIMPKYGFGRAFACLGRTILPAALPHSHHRLDPGPGLHHELFRHELHPGSGLYRRGGGLPVLLALPGLGGRLPHRVGHLLQRPVHLPAEDHGPADRGGPPPDGGRQLQRRRHRQNDLAPEHRGGLRRHRPGGRRRGHLPLDLLPQRGHVRHHRGAHPAPGLLVQVHAAVMIYDD